jgi:hypothetical protein
MFYKMPMADSAVTPRTHGKNRINCRWEMPIAAGMGRTRHVFWIGGIALAIVGFDVFCWQRFCAQVASKNYVTVSGRVTRCRMANDFAGPTDLTRQHFQFSYCYRINGQEYSGRTWRFLENLSPPVAFAQMPEGKVIPVFCDPENPARAVLVRGSSEQDVVKMLQLFCLNTMAFSLLGLWARWRTRTVFNARPIWES